MWMPNHFAAAASDVKGVGSPASQDAIVTRPTMEPIKLMSLGDRSRSRSHEMIESGVSARRRFGVPQSREAVRIHTPSCPSSTERGKRQLWPSPDALTAPFMQPANARAGGRVGGLGPCIRRVRIHSRAMSWNDARRASSHNQSVDLRNSAFLAGRGGVPCRPHGGLGSRVDGGCDAQPWNRWRRRHTERLRVRRRHRGAGGHGCGAPEG
jgi:hypothetical protein